MVRNHKNRNQKASCYIINPAANVRKALRARPNDHTTIPAPLEPLAVGAGAAVAEVKLGNGAEVDAPAPVRVLVVIVLARLLKLESSEVTLDAIEEVAAGKLDTMVLIALV